MCFTIRKLILRFRAAGARNAGFEHAAKQSRTAIIQLNLGIRTAVLYHANTYNYLPKWKLIDACVRIPTGLP